MLDEKDRMLAGSHRSLTAVAVLGDWRYHQTLRVLMAESSAVLGAHAGSQMTAVHGAG